MFTYQDFLNAGIDRENMLTQIITGFTSSSEYRKMQIAEQYYKQQNVEILKRGKWMYDSDGGVVEDNFKANNKLCSGFFPFIVRQTSSYLLGNGLTIDSNIKDNLGENFDSNLYSLGIYAQVYSVGWEYVYIDDEGNFATKVFKGTEFIPLYDERTGALRAGIRFWQIDTSKPINIELYEEDGITEYSYSNSSITLYQPKRPYIRTLNVTAGVSTVVKTQNWKKLPIVPMYFDDVKQSVFTDGLKRNIDLYDKISSDLGNNLEDAQDIYWVLTNYGGEDLQEFLTELKYYKIIQMQGGDEENTEGSAEAHTMDIPYEARKVALELLNERIYADAMAMDTKQLTGSSLTTTAVKVAYNNLDLKCDVFEMQVISFITNILELYRNYVGLKEKPNFELIRRGLVNDTEIIDNLTKMRSEISTLTYYKLNPYIQDPEEEIKRVEEERLKAYNEGFMNDFMSDDEEEDKKIKTDDEKNDK